METFNLIEKNPNFFKIGFNCCKCNKPIYRFTSTPNHKDLSYDIEVFCHNSSQKLKLNKSQIEINHAIVVECFK